MDRETQKKFGVWCGMGDACLWNEMGLRPYKVVIRMALFVTESDMFQCEGQKRGYPFVGGFEGKIKRTPTILWVQEKKTPPYCGSADGEIPRNRDKSPMTTDKPLGPHLCPLDCPMENRECQGLDPEHSEEAKPGEKGTRSGGFMCQNAPFLVWSETLPADSNTTSTHTHTQAPLSRHPTRIFFPTRGAHEGRCGHVPGASRKLRRAGAGERLGAEDARGGCSVRQSSNWAVVVKTVLDPILGVGEFATHFRTYLSGWISAGSVR